MTKIGSYSIGYTVSLKDYNSVTSTREGVFSEQIYDLCTAEQGLAVIFTSDGEADTISDIPKYFFTGFPLLHSLGTNLFASNEVNCPI